MNDPLLPTERAVVDAKWAVVRAARQVTDGFDADADLPRLDDDLARAALTLVRAVDRLDPDEQPHGWPDGLGKGVVPVDTRSAAVR